MDSASKGTREPRETQCYYSGSQTYEEASHATTPSPPIKSLDFRGFDSSKTLNCKGREFSCPLNLIGSLLESLTQRLLVGKLLVGGLYCCWRSELGAARTWPPQMSPQTPRTKNFQSPWNKVFHYVGANFRSPWKLTVVVFGVVNTWMRSLSNLVRSAAVCGDVEVLLGLQLTVSFERFWLVRFGLSGLQLRSRLISRRVRAVEDANETCTSRETQTPDTISLWWTGVENHLSQHGRALPGAVDLNTVATTGTTNLHLISCQSMRVRRMSEHQGRYWWATSLFSRCKSVLLLRTTSRSFQLCVCSMSAVELFEYFHGGR